MIYVTEKGYMNPDKKILVNPRHIVRATPVAGTSYVAGTTRLDLNLYESNQKDDLIFHDMISIYVVESLEEIRLGISK